MARIEYKKYQPFTVKLTIENRSQAAPPPETALSVSGSRAECVNES